MIELPESINLVELVKKVYNLSQPQGMGFMHFTPAPLSEDEAKKYIDLSSSFPSVINMDYVHGRACKFHVTRRDGKLFIPDSWYDHTDEQYKKLLYSFGIAIPEKEAPHGCACNCENCRNKRA